METKKIDWDKYSEDKATFLKEVILGKDLKQIAKTQEELVIIFNWFAADLDFYEDYQKALMQFAAIAHHKAVISLDLIIDTYLDVLNNGNNRERIAAAKELLAIANNQKDFHLESYCYKLEQTMSVKKDKNKPPTNAQLELSFENP